MNREDELLREIEALRERLSRLSEASLRINESLGCAPRAPDCVSAMKPDRATHRAASQQVWGRMDGALRESVGQEKRGRWNSHYSSGLDDDAAAVLHFDVQIVPVQESHTHKWDDVGGVGLYVYRLPVPEHVNTVGREGYLAAVGQGRPVAGQEGQPQFRN